MDQITKKIKAFINRYPDAHIEITSKQKGVVVKMTTEIKLDGEECPFTLYIYMTGFHNDQKPEC